jgi:nucleoside-diphosphate-sugar epimerase
MASGKIAAISGATGFLGSALCQYLGHRGYTVRAMARTLTSRPAGLETIEWYLCSLPDRVEEEAFKGGVHTFIHCAFDTRFTSAAHAWQVNVEGSRRVFACCRANGVKKIVFISSLSAHQRAISMYGTSKLRVEALLNLETDLVIRPGQIIGEGGLFWRSACSIRRMPFIPLFFGGRQRLQTIALADACEGIFLALEKDLTGVIGLAELEPVELRALYGAIAEALHKKARFVRIPGNPTLLFLRLAEKLGLQLPLSSDNLLGLKRLETFDLREDLARLGLRPRTAWESLAQVQWDKLQEK